MTMLTKKGVKFQWTDECQEAFDTLKERLTTAPILARPDLNEDFILYTDASRIGLGAVLSQVQEGKEQVIAYASKTTNNSQSNYGATQLEMCALVWAIRHFRHFLIGRKFKLITDHTALKWLMGIQQPEGLYARWISKTMEYDFDVIYKPGPKHKNADALSRIRTKEVKLMENSRNLRKRHPPEESQDSDSDG